MIDHENEVTYQDSYEDFLQTSAKEIEAPMGDLAIEGKASAEAKAVKEAKKLLAIEGPDGADGTTAPTSAGGR